MPLLSQRLSEGVPAGYTPTESNMQKAVPQSGPASSQGPAPNMFVRCPMPPVWDTNPDSARQFYRKGVAQYKTWGKSLNRQ